MSLRTGYWVESNGGIDQIRKVGLRLLDDAQIVPGQKHLLAGGIDQIRTVGLRHQHLQGGFEAANQPAPGISG